MRLCEETHRSLMRCCFPTQNAMLCGKKEDLNAFAFWVFGFSCNFGYTVILTAAEDILEASDGSTLRESPKPLHCGSPQTDRECSSRSTGVILLAAILPCLGIKMLANLGADRLTYTLRVVVILVGQTASFLIVASTSTFWLVLFGICLGSFASGLCEVTLLAFASYFAPKSVTFWGVGTGCSGLFASAAYAGLTQIGLSPHHAILAMLLQPAAMTFVYCRVLQTPAAVWRPSVFRPSTWIVPKKPTQRTEDASDKSPNEYEPLLNSAPARSKPRILLGLIRFMLPLALVFFAEYVINQGLAELIVFHCGFLRSRESQYRWYFVVYQVGVLLSRSSATCFTLPHWLMPVMVLLQLGNLALYTTEALWYWAPSLWLVLGGSLWVGLLGGAVYSHTIAHIRTSSRRLEREWSLGAATMADAVGISLAALASLPLRRWVCDQPLSVWGNRF